MFSLGSEEERAGCKDEGKGNKEDQKKSFIANVQEKKTKGDFTENPSQKYFHEVALLA